MADNDQDRQLPATQRRIEKAREDGQVARSRDLGHFAVMGSGVALLSAFAPELTRWLQNLLTRGLRFNAQTLAQPASMSERLSDLAVPMFAALLPIGSITALLAVAAGVLCGGWNFTLKPLQPAFDKLNPLSGIGRVFSLHQLTDTLKACLLAVILGAVGALCLAQQWAQHAQLLAMPLPRALAAGGDLLRTGLLVLGGVLAAFALVDVPLQRQMHLRRLRMSVQELKQEMKEVNGSAEIKQKMKQRMREMSNRRMLSAVPTADLVVMNPTHYAVALKYDENSGRAPRVVAKGADLLAMRIRDLAQGAKVPVLQAPPLARALYTHCEVDQEIPARLFAAVAQVLAWVYQLRDAMAAGRTLATEPPVPEVPADMDPLNPAAATAAGAGNTKAKPGRVEPEL
jgi:flagellar biosynthetic protein FlhB